MQKIPLTLAYEGLILAQDIRNEDNPDGPPLCGRGVTLTESLISRLNRMGVQAISVEGHPIRMDGEKTLEEELAVLDERFKKVKDDPLMKKLKELYRVQIVKARS
ncbi:MAG TPA: hypothetical protein VK435_08470 [Thermodesulfovibrionales bacterium]|nr:hypothetical protein [Thermodesulfovibrionales bacterium]